jgi:hypothetical protein
MRAKRNAPVAAIILPSVHCSHDAIYINVAALPPTANIAQGAFVKPYQVPITPTPKGLVFRAVSKLAGRYVSESGSS